MLEIGVNLERITDQCILSDGTDLVKWIANPKCRRDNLHIDLHLSQSKFLNMSNCVFECLSKFWQDV